MQALGMIETKGTLASIEALDTMLKAADVSFFEKQKVGGGRVSVLVTGDVAAVKAAVDAAVTAVKRIHEDCLLSCHVIPRPHDETMGLFETAKDSIEVLQKDESEIKVPEVKEPEVQDPEVKEPEVREPEIEKPEVREPKAETVAEEPAGKEKTEAKSSKKNKTN